MLSVAIKRFMLSVIMLNVIMPSVIMLRVVILNIMLPCFTEYHYSAQISYWVLL
jgi:hypothetical protein